jgi:hypothetical protein
MKKGEKNMIKAGLWFMQIMSSRFIGTESISYRDIKLLVSYEQTGVGDNFGKFLSAAMFNVKHRKYSLRYYGWDWTEEEVREIYYEFRKYDNAHKYWQCKTAENL